MNLRKRVFSIFILLILPASVLAITPLIPLQKGMEWIYEGTVEWQPSQVAGGIKSKNIRLKTEIIELFAKRGTHRSTIAVVRGFPSDLAWYSDGKELEYSVLIVTRRNVYHLPAADKNEAFRLARKVSLNRALPSADAILFYPLLKCDHSSGGFYIKGINPHSVFKCEQSSRRTNPDIETIDFARGLGIVRYFYNHFGTTASADVELKEVRFPKRPFGNASKK